jgi:hypothetical protein
MRRPTEMAPPALAQARKGPRLNYDAEVARSESAREKAGDTVICHLCECTEKEESREEFERQRARGMEGKAASAGDGGRASLFS